MARRLGGRVGGRRPPPPPRGAGLGALREAEARWLLGEIAFRRGDLEAAESELARSVEGMGGASLLWTVASGRLIAVLRARGKLEAAAEMERARTRVRAASGGPGVRVLGLDRADDDLEQPLGQ